MQAGAQPTLVGRQPEAATHLAIDESRGERLAQQVQAGTGAGGQPEALAYAALDIAGRRRIAARRRAFDTIDLVEQKDLRNVAGADLGQHRVDLSDPLVAQFVRRIDHVQQQVGVARF